ncbi:MAG TPA: DUF3899 domain-containing protein [Erysipelotrichaceae bacterium]|nr:DUF3899 domain-containing protein [Erysipelotrichaceae bacterium]
MQKKNKIKKTILQYCITTGACLIVGFVIAVLYGLFTPWEALKESRPINIDSELTKVFFILTNSAFIVGVLTASFGLLILAANGGAFEMIVYGIRRFFSLFQKDVNKIKFKTFYDYHIYNQGKPKQPFLFLVVVGLVFIGLSMIFYVIYAQNYTPVNLRAF